MDVWLLRSITITSLITILILLVVPSNSLFFPMYQTRYGSFTLSASNSYSKSIDCDSGRIAVIQFSADHAALEFFIVHSDFYDLSGLPDASQCEYHIISQSATHQFMADRSGTWYLVFANSPQDQVITYSWTDYSLEEWNTRQITNWSIILIAILSISVVAIRYVTKTRSAQSAVDKEKSGAEGVI